MSDKIIDPHVHFFNLTEGQYTWLQGSNPPAWPNLDKIKKQITASELKAACPFQLKALVHLEAGFDNQAPVNELNWLATHLNDIPYRAISYSAIDASSKHFEASLNKLEHPSLVGIRDITEGEETKRLLTPHCQDNLAMLASENLHFEAQFEIEDMQVTEQLIKYCTALPSLRVVINHLGFISNEQIWLEAIIKLSRCDNIAIKFSGLEFTQIATNKHLWLINNLVKYFGENRVMFASNFPVCQINTSYTNCWQHYHSLCSQSSLWHKLSYKNAHEIYQIV
ncbi:amidohydrolase family protein [Pseudoalteromonas sp. BZP1]|uniref:amidohydrolase family protein n=1 Tax=unclassified Pseudoalteromonas TaxID=194690 RepID=UPI0032C42611|tara:strand:+ start:1161 stop:2003 length:843 start_codon:yes stop_codon:yes gene_type:complete